MSLLSATKNAIEISDLSVSYSAVVNAKASERQAFKQVHEKFNSARQY